MKHTFKKFQERVLAFFAPSPEGSLTKEAAKQRRSEALTKFAQAFFTVLIALWIAPVFFAQGPVIMIVAAICSLPFVMQGVILWLSAISITNSTTGQKVPTPVHQGAKTENPPNPAPQSSPIHKPPTPAAKTPQKEKTTGSSFRELQQQGWKITCNLSLPNGETVDVFLQSPKGNAFIVDVQSQWGEVVYEEGVLKLRQGIGVSNFENDLLGQITDRAIAVKKMKRLRSVTPILCFTEAALSIETVNNKARDVYIVKREFLVRKLLRLEKD